MTNIAIIFIIYDVGLVVLLTVSFALQRLCNFMKSHLLILDLTTQAIAVLFSNYFPFAHILEAFPHFLLYKFQSLWFYVEFLDPLRLELCTRR
jgi:exosortase/archaeosortase